MLTLPISREYRGKSISINPPQHLNPVLTFAWLSWEMVTDASHCFDYTQIPVFGCDLKYMLAGHGLLHYHDKIYPLEPGQAFLLRSSEKARLSVAAGGAPWEFLSLFICNGRDLQGHVNTIIHDYGPVFQLPKQGHALQAWSELFPAAASGRLDDQLLLAESVYHLIMQLYRDLQTVSPPASSHAICREAANLIEQHFRSNFRMLELAVSLKVSQGHLCRLFRRHYGLTPLQYLTNIRLEHALTYLRETDLSIHSIAQRCGFDNGNYFNRVFQQAQCMTPGEYRRQQR